MRSEGVSIVRYQRPSDPNKGGIIYGLTDPRPEHAHQPIRYIGQTHCLRERAKHYRSHFKHGDAHNPALRHWFNKLKTMGLTYGIVELDRCSVGLGDLERQWIEEARADGWKLLNCSDGGETGSTWNEQTRRQQSELSKKKWESEEYKANWRAGQLKRWGMTQEQWDQREADRKAEKERNRAIWLRNMELKKQLKAQRERDARLVPLTHKGMAFLPMTRGKYWKIPLADWHIATKRKWHIHVSGAYMYPRTTINNRKVSLSAYLHMEKHECDTVGVGGRGSP